MLGAAHPSTYRETPMPRSLVVPRNPRARASTTKWRQCAAGRLPAESLSQRDRDELVRALHSRGWTDAEIAGHCHMSLYTAGRILDRLGLDPNPSKDTAAS